MQEFLITFREGLEASLILGIVYTRLQKLGWKEGLQMFWLAVGSALALSLGFGLMLNLLSAQWGGTAVEPLLEAVLMLLATAFLLHMVVWMAGSSAHRDELVAGTAARSGVLTLFLLIFFALVREGLETVLFLAALASQASLSLLWAALGLGLAAFIGYLLFLQGRRMPIRQLFDYSSVLLLFLTAGLASGGVHELLEGLRALGYAVEMPTAWNVFLPTLPDPDGACSEGLWPLLREGHCYDALHHKGRIGTVLQAFTGYRSKANWAEVAAWALVLVGGGLLWWQRRSDNLKSKA